jgi:uncharacterized protein (DUF58 family)
MVFSPDELFDSQFLESLQHLKLVARRVPAGGRFAEQRSADLGHGIEFRDFRPYAPGDDLRGVDWNIYRRLGRVFLRLFEEFEDLPLYLMPDVSRSAFLESPPRALAGLRCALALAAVSLGQHDQVGVFPFSDDLNVLVRPQSGKRRVLSFAQRLAEVEPGGRTDLVRSLRRLGGMRLRHGLLVIVSDFFDPAGIDAVLEALGHVRHRLLLVQLVRDSDRDPRIQGEVRLRDCETGEVEDVSVTGQVLESYRAAFTRFETAIADFARRRNAGLLRLDVESEVVPQLASLFESGHYAV